MPQLIDAVTLLEAAGILISRGEFRTFIDLCRYSLKYGTEACRRQHLQPGYYDQWRRRKERHSSPRVAQQAGQLNYNPLISLIIAINQADFGRLRASLTAISEQWYPHWELFLVGESSTLTEMGSVVKELLHGQEARVFLIAQDYSSPKEALTAVLAAAPGEFVVFPAAGDLLAPVALLEVAKLLNRQPEADIIYADEDALDAAGQRSAPFFKPDWSPDLALSMPYTGPFTVYRTSLARAVGELQGELPAAAYDLLLRAMTQTRPAKIHHIAKILYHRRSVPPNLAPDQKDLVERPARQALQAHLQRTSQTGTVTAGTYPGTYRLLRELHEPAGVSIIIPFKDSLPLLSQCLDSIFRKTDYPVYEIILINNQSRERATLAYLEQAADNPRIRLLDFQEPFNFAAMNNRAAEQARYPYILFLNNDTEVISPDWLQAMLEHIQRPEVGAVGAKLLFPDHTIQHGGLALGGGGMLCGDYFRGLPEKTELAAGLAQVVRNCSAVTAACLLTRKELFQAVRGFDEVNLPICYNDVDLCLKLRDRGYLIVWTPYATLYHYESASRGKDLKVAELARLCREQAYFEEKWWHIIEQDPYYNPNLSRLFDGYAY